MFEMFICCCKTAKPSVIFFPQKIAWQTKNEYKKFPVKSTPNFRIKFFESLKTLYCVIATKTHKVQKSNSGLTYFNLNFSVNLLSLKNEKFNFSVEKPTTYLL